jgi:Ca2+-transporting ATPase
MALTFDPSTPGIMERKPRGSDAKILTFSSTMDICFTGLLEAACGIIMFLYVMQGDYQGGTELDRARTMVYLGILCAQFMNILSRRLGNESLWNRYFFSSPKLFMSFALSLTAVASFILFPPFANFLGFGMPHAGDIGVLLVVLTIFTLIVEGKKKVMRQREVKREAIVAVS